MDPQLGLAGGQGDVEGASSALVPGRGAPGPWQARHSAEGPRGSPVPSRRGCPQACYHWPGPSHQPQQELAEAAKWPPASSSAPEEGGGEGVRGGAAPAVCAWGDCHGYILTKQIALLAAGRLSSHRHVGIPQAGCQGAGHWAWALEPSPGRPLQQLWVRGGQLWGCGPRQYLPRHVLLLGQVRAGPACGRTRGRLLGCPGCVCRRACTGRGG